MPDPHSPTYRAVCRGGQVFFEEPVDLADGTKLLVQPVLDSDRGDVELPGHVIIVGFGLAGRSVADLLAAARIPFKVVEINPLTVQTQTSLGRDVILGDGTDAQSLTAAGLHDASILALTMPDEEAVLEATRLARRLRPDIYIIARTNYASKGMQATQLGANEVIKAEQAVALQFYQRLAQRLHTVAQA